MTLMLLDVLDDDGLATQEGGGADSYDASLEVDL
jgi:hypothetical protein